MARAYVVMTCDLGSETDLIRSLRSIDGVKEAHGILGMYDIIAQVESDSGEKIQEIVTQTIRQIPKVRSTMTLTRSESEEIFHKSENSEDIPNNTQAYLVIHCNKGDEFPTLKVLSHVAEVKEADVVFGLYDVICRIGAADEESLQNAILKKIRTLPSVKSCMTLNVMKEQGS